MTFDGWVEEREAADRYSMSFTKEAVTESAKYVPFKPIAPRLNLKEWQMALDGKDIDVTFHVKGQVFTAHKLKLMANSPYFKELLAAPLVKTATIPAQIQTTGCTAVSTATAAAEANVKSQASGLSTDDRNVVVIQDIEPAIFKLLLQFIYTGSIDNGVQESFVKEIGGLINVMEKAERLQIDGFVAWAADIVRAYLERNKNPGHDGVVKLLKFGFKSEASQIFEALKGLLEDRDSYKDALIEAIRSASTEGLITKENWKMFKQVMPCGHYRSNTGEVTRNSEAYNPIIFNLVNSK